MTFSFEHLKIILLSLVFLTFLSCEKEEAGEKSSATQILPIKIISKTDASGTADLVITDANGRTTTHNSLKYGEIQEIETDLTAEGTYMFAVEDVNLGRIKMYATKESLANYTLNDPYTLQFEHYKNQKVATFEVKSETGPEQRRFIDLTLMQSYESSLYHIDWGDGSEEIAEAPSEVQSPSDRIEHRYATSGEYTITLSTTNREEVEGLDLQITGNGTGDEIQTLELETLPNLTYLSLGDSNLENIDSILVQYPKLNHLSIRFGNLNTIDLSQNPLLELLIVTENFGTVIKGISALTNLKFLGLTGTVENLEVSLFPELQLLSIKGHKMNTLDVSQNTKLTSLSLQLNNLVEIDVSANVNLESLYITNNRLTHLNLTSNTEIQHLNLYANYIEELDLSQQAKLEYLNLSSVQLKQVTAPESLDEITYINLENARFLDEAELLDAVFKGQDNNAKKEGQIIFNEFAVVLDRQIVLLNQLVEDHDWIINVPE